MRVWSRREQSGTSRVRPHRGGVGVRRIFAYLVRGASLTLVSAALLSSAGLQATKTPNLSGLSVYVGSLGSKPGAVDLQKQLTEELRKVSGIRVVSSEAKADAVIQGQGEVWARGYYSLNPRAGNAPGRGQPILGGFLSVELVSRSDGVLWSYLAAPHPGAEDVEQDLAKQVTRNLKLAIMKAAPTKP